MTMDNKTENEQIASSTSPISRKSTSIFGSCSSATKGLVFALVSGILASFAGTLGKFAMTSGDSVWLCQSLTSTLMRLTDENAFMTCSKVSIYLQVTAFITMILMNGIMWTTFVKALRYCNSSLEATVTNTAANFFSSALVGQILFGETLTLLWWIGTLLIIFGLLLMSIGKKGGEIRLGDIFTQRKGRKRKSH